ncbi:MAG: bifunctional proline dehydrogenase/L-glutamate gamma-semialdehyde dehydrogenase PutA [Pseudomonadota bacterium]
MSETLRHAIRLAGRCDEAACVARLVREMESIRLDRSGIARLARQLVEQVRRERQHASGVDQLMYEYPLSSPEGQALMGLAEALLRIPDPATAAALIHDKLALGDWSRHRGHSASLLVNAATLGLDWSRSLGQLPGGGLLQQALQALVHRGGEPLVRKGIDFALRLLGQQFVMGEDIATALERAAPQVARGYRHSFDMLGEAALTAADSARYFAAYQQAIHAIGEAAAGQGCHAGPGISIKLSALHPRYVRSQQQRVMRELQPRLKALLQLARQYDIGVNIDAEEAERLELSLDLLASLAADPDLAGWQGLGFVVQAYQKRAPAVIDYLIGLARASGRRLMLRLVKGAYWDGEIKRAQVDGLADYPVYTRKPHTDLAYLVAAHRLLAAPDAIYPQFATHNAHTLATVMDLARQRGVDDYEFQCLHGMGEALYDHLVGPAQFARPCRIYAPVGAHHSLLPYLVRRLLENGANSSFVHRLVDADTPIEQLIQDPLVRVRQLGGRPHPAIPLPARLFGDARDNSAGVDLADELSLGPLLASLRELDAPYGQAGPLLATPPVVLHPQWRPVRNPAATGEILGYWRESSAEEREAAVAAAVRVAPDWAATPPGERAARLRQVAALLESRRHELVSLCQREAGKTLANALGEVREAVDFLRYYAAEAEKLSAEWIALPTPGPALCISPWNFPLAIFVGQVAAALAAGCPVLAKPAEQTPLTAHLATRLCHEAGIPAAVLQLLPGQGESVGAALVADPRLRRIQFTGSLAVARLIHGQLAGRPEVRLVAETGGINAMVADATALPEQLVQDVLASAFDSAGQRCSALRLLCLQQDIADGVLDLLRQAMAELQAGDPRRLETDVGPLIDAPARQQVLAHVAALRQRGYPVFQLPLPADCADGHFVAPTVIEIPDLSGLQQEVFGPVVHVLRFRHGEAAALLEQLNGLGYGLTQALHSRLEQHITLFRRHSRVGNLYINRNQIGAVVGVQPFGGEGLSGTGPKAGGPLLLPWLAGLDRLPAELSPAAPPWPPLLRELDDWAQQQGLASLRAQCADYAARCLLDWEIPLPGPTGESNQLSFHPRGPLRCDGPDRAALLHQLAACLASGNTAVFPDTPDGDALRQSLPAPIRAAIHSATTTPVACLGSPASNGEPAAPLATATAALAPLSPSYLATAASRYPLHRLFSERVCTRNTAAAGGNAALVSMGE